MKIKYKCCCGGSQPCCDCSVPAQEILCTTGISGWTNVDLPNFFGDVVVPFNSCASMPSSFVMQRVYPEPDIGGCAWLYVSSTIGTYQVLPYVFPGEEAGNLVPVRLQAWLWLATVQAEPLVCHTKFFMALVESSWPVNSAKTYGLAFPATGKRYWDIFGDGSGTINGSPMTYPPTSYPRTEGPDVRGFQCNSGGMHWFSSGSYGYTFLGDFDGFYPHYWHVHPRAEYLATPPVFQQTPLCFGNDNKIIGFAPV